MTIAVTARSPRSRGPASLRSRSGFSLIEVLVALGIVGAAFAAAEALVHAVPLARTTRDEDLALVIARGELESVRIAGYAAAPASGPFSSSLMASLPSGAGTRAVSDFNTGTKQVTVTVSWQPAGGSAARSLLMSTLVAETGGLP
ncbi:MAG: prepilin-type N-terminal cleavage/methylation domain-containing protein [bacterium]|nr:prepilin-type N-terminal cleavage/methylation domain-containing protein [bacterium]